MKHPLAGTTTGPAKAPDPARRQTLKAGVGLGAAALAAQAAAKAPAPATTLSRHTLARWSHWLDALVPGAAAAGAATYLVGQLGQPRDASTLFLRYMDWPGSPADFYRDGLDAVEALAQRLSGRPFAALDADARKRLIDAVAAGQPEGWTGPPAGLFYFVSKADGADLVFGTRPGIERLGLDYRAHIDPPAPWPGATGIRRRART